VPFDLVFNLLCAGALLAFAVVNFGLSRSGRFRRWSGKSFAKRNLAWVDQPLAAELDEALARRFRYLGWWIVAMAVVWFGLTTFGPGDSPWLMVWVGVVMLGVPLTAALACYWRPQRLGPDAPTAVRRDLEVADYVPRYERVLAWVMGIGSLVAALVTVVIEIVNGGPHAWLSILPGLGLAAEVGVVELVARRVVAVPQRAVDAAHLYWQDALRSESLRYAYTQLLVPAMLVWMFAAPVLVGGLGRRPDVSVPFTVGAVGVAVVGLILALANLEGPGTRWFRRQLWATLGPWQVVRPGDVLPTVD